MTTPETLLSSKSPDNGNRGDRMKLQTALASGTETGLHETMKAVVCHGPRDYRLEEVPAPQPGPGEVLVRVVLAGVCASDGKAWDGAPKIWGTNDGQGR
jgi:hypothetical protein